MCSCVYAEGFCCFSAVQMLNLMVGEGRSKRKGGRKFVDNAGGIKRN